MENTFTDFRYDLLGNKKQFAYQFRLEHFKLAIQEAISLGKYEISTPTEYTKGRKVAYLLNASDKRPLFSVWMDKLGTTAENKALAFELICEKMHKDSVKTAVECGQFQQEYMSGRMSQEDVKEISFSYFQS